MNSENTRDGLLRRAEAENFNGNSGRLYGYTHDATTGLLALNNAEAEILRQVFDWYTKHKWSVLKTAKLLNLKKIPAKTRSQWSRGCEFKTIKNPSKRPYSTRGRSNNLC